MFGEEEVIQKQQVNDVVELIGILTLVDPVEGEASSYVIHGVYVHNLQFALKELGKEVRPVKGSVQKKGERITTKSRYKWERADRETHTFTMFYAGLFSLVVSVLIAAFCIWIAIPKGSSAAETKTKDKPNTIIDNKQPKKINNPKK